MRDFGRVLPQFWIGETGRLLRGYPEAQVIALYLITGPSANAIGLYYLPMPTLCHETGCPVKGALKALRRVSEAGLAQYAEAHEAVWVPEMARIQIAPTLKPGDKRIVWVVKEATSQCKSPFLLVFYEKDRVPFHLPDEGPWKGLRRPFEGASGSIHLEQDQEQEQEKDQDLRPTPSQSKREGEVSKSRPRKPDPEVARVIRTWHESFTAKHGSPPPVSGGKAGSIAKRLLSGRSPDEAVWLVQEFFRATPSWYADRNLYGIEHVLAAAPSLLARRAKEPREY